MDNSIGFYEYDNYTCVQNARPFILYCHFVTVRVVRDESRTTRTPRRWEVALALCEAGACSNNVRAGFPSAKPSLMGQAYEPTLVGS